MSSTMIRGRFLPSRVYNRWKWTVRFGLMLVPFILMEFAFPPGRSRISKPDSVDNP